MPMIAELDLDPIWITKNKLKERDDVKPKFTDIPLYGSIAAGTPIKMFPVDETHPIPTEVHNEYPDAFLLKANGDSMNRIIPNGCYVLVDPYEMVEHDGKPRAVCVNGFDATAKRAHKLANGLELAPNSTDSTFRPTAYDYGELGTEEITVIGHVLWHTLPFEWRF